MEDASIHVFANEQEARIFAVMHNLPVRKLVEIEIAAAVLSLEKTRDLTALLGEKRHLAQVMGAGGMNRANQVVYGVCDDVLLEAFQMLGNVEIHASRHTIAKRWSTSVKPIETPIPYVVPMCDIVVAAKILGKTNVSGIVTTLLPLVPPEIIVRYLLQAEFLHFKEEAEAKYERLEASKEHFKKMAVKYEYQAKMTKTPLQAALQPLYQAIIDKRM